MKSKIITALLIILFSGLVKSSFAQDVIILTNGDEILSIVNEVGIDVIKYKKFDNQTGPVYTIEKSKVFMIKYQNGSKDVFSQQPVATPKPDTVVKKTVTPPVTPPTPKVTPPPPPVYLTYGLGVKKNNVKLTDEQVRALYANHREALNLYNQGASLVSVAGLFSWLEIGMLFLTGYGMNHPELVPGATKESILKRGLIIIGSMMVVGVSCNISGNQKKRASTVIYNDDIKKASSGNLQQYLQCTGLEKALQEYGRN